MSRVSKKLFRTRERDKTKRFFLPERKNERKSGRASPAHPRKNPSRRSKRIVEMSTILYKTVGRREKYRPTVERFFRLPMGVALRVYEKNARGRRRKKRSPTKNIFPGGGTKYRKRRVKRPPTPREYATPRRSYRPVWRCILPPQREWFRHRISGPASRVCSTVRAATAHPRATG